MANAKELERRRLAIRSRLQSVTREKVRLARTCAGCGVGIGARNYRAKLCEDCAKTRWRERNCEARRCAECSADISARHYRAKFCEDCVIDRRLELQRECRSTPEYKARAYHQRPEYKEYQKVYRQRPENKAYQKAYSKKHQLTPEYKEYQKVYRQRPENKAYQKAYSKAYQKVYHQRPEAKKLSREGSRRYNARKLGQLGIVSNNIESVLMKQQRNRCAAPWCLKRLDQLNKWHLDHIIPLSRGGMHDDSNLQILCVHCNLSKNAKHPDDWLKEHGQLPLLVSC